VAAIFLCVCVPLLTRLAPLFVSQCDWDCFVGRDTFLRLGLGRDAFTRMAKWTSWCTSNARAGADAAAAAAAAAGPADEDEAPVEHAAAPVADGAALGAEFASREAKAALGRACKRLIDAARAAYVRDVLGLPGAEVRHFVEREVTPENAVVVAGRPGPSP